MCGICGFTNANENDLNMLIKMCDTMAHRGPDGQGTYIHDGIAFGHRRLTLIDLESGDQPIVRQSNNKDSRSWHAAHNCMCERGDYVIVFNGEIYNYKELNEELEKEGYSFSTKSDTETVLVSYIHWGKNCLKKFRGMFAFAIFNSNNGDIFCARDFFGIKPFYYTNSNGTFIFASEIKVMLEHKDCPREVNQEALEQYLCFQFSALQETMFKGIFVLPQGHYMIVHKDGSYETHRYWRPEFKTNSKGKSTDKKNAQIYCDHKLLTKTIDNTMRESVKYHNVADVEVGSLLSSGIDSSYNASLLHEINPSIQTFTVGFDEYSGSQDMYHGERNEIKWAKELAEIMNVKNYSHTINEEEYWEALPTIAWHMDEPNGDPSAIALYFVDKLASKHVKAVLSGEGADELFGGYTIYGAPLTAGKLDKIPKPILKSAASVMKSMKLRGHNYLNRASKTVDEWYYTNAYASAYSIKDREKLLKKCSGKTPQSIMARTYSEAKKDGLDQSTQMQYADLHYWILGDILLKGDKMSMAHSLECRVPFLDKEVFKIASGLPRDEKVLGENTKIALRDAAKSSIPTQWAEKKKLGFPVPMVSWLREDKYYNKIAKAFKSKTANKYFNTDYLIELLDQHKEEKINNSRKIWIVYMFLLWHKVFFEDTDQSS